MPTWKPVGVISGSISDSVIMDYCTDTLTELNINYDVIVASAHRDPDKVRDWVKGARDRGNQIIIAGAGMSAALPGVVASYTDLPVIGVPMKSELNGLDSLLSISQMPRGVPVACMAIGMHGAINAALFAKRILNRGARPATLMNAGGSLTIKNEDEPDEWRDDTVYPGDHDQDLWRDD